MNLSPLSAVVRYRVRIVLLVLVYGWVISPVLSVKRLFAQSADGLHTVQLVVRGLSMVQMEVDGVVVFVGRLSAGELRRWQGRNLLLTLESDAPAQLTLDGQLQETLDPTGQPLTFRWPTTAVTTRAPSYYIVQPDDTLFLIAQRFGTDVETLLRANQLDNVDLIYVGTGLIIPGSDGSLPPPSAQGVPLAASPTISATVPRPSVTERLTAAAQQASPISPYYKTTWLTYYGRPAVPIMGILGEHELDQLTPIFKQEIAAYDKANGDELGVVGAYHLVYGMAAKAPGDDGSHLIFLADEVVERYITRAEQEGFGVILDIQIGALSPADALAYGLPWLAYDNVHLALDPEFAISHKGQRWPGDPIGFVTAAQVNDAQQAMQQYMRTHQIFGPRILLLHQFLDTMIVDKQTLKWDYPGIALTVAADGWGGPWGKISKYNAFMDAATRFSAFKLFYRWDEPLLTPREALGIDGYGEGGYIEVTPNLIIYQ